MGKKQYNLTEKQKMFEAKGVPVPSSEEELRDLIMHHRFQTKFMKDALKDHEILTEDQIEEDYADKSDLLEKFLLSFDIVYASRQTDDEGETDTEPEDAGDAAQKLCLDSLEEARAFYQKEKERLCDGKGIKVKGPTIRRGMDISVHDNFVVRFKGMEVLQSAALLLSADNKQVAAVGKILEKEEAGRKNKYFVAEKEQIDFEKMANATRFSLVLLGKEYGEYPEQSGNLYCKEVSITVEEMEKTQSVLCIDFGTSNTTVGSYGVKEAGGVEPEIVDFVDVTNGNCLEKLCPTIVYVQDCSEDGIRYLFGYEAKKKVIENTYDMVADVFYEVKSWIGDTTEIRLKGENGKLSRPVARCRIAKAYIDYIIDTARDYFKVEFERIHFSAPVKMKSVFVQSLKKMFQEDKSPYMICDESESIDEAAAIIYDYIYEKEIIKYGDSDGREKKIVVLDCGGGTTDLATCAYQVSTVRDSYIKITGKTQFENGSSIYGGNNITYKILQLIKIKICKSLGKISDSQYEEIFRYSEKDILGAIDVDMGESGKGEYTGSRLLFYQKFNELYQLCERHIPTRFLDNPDFNMDEDRKAIKRNYYLLWQLAETVKLNFYREEEVQVEFEDSAKMLDIPESSNSLYRSEGEELVLMPNPTKGIRITITDIRKIICGDIYILLNNILPEHPETYDYYQLSGQSCKINLFNELLKEFIPGKKLRSKLKQEERDENSVVLKLRCIVGSIHYMAHKEHGKCELDIAADMPKLIFRVYNYYDYEEGAGTPLFDLERRNAMFVYLTDEQKYIDLLVERIDGGVTSKRTFVKETGRERFVKLTVADLKKNLKANTALQDVDSLVDKIEKVQKVEGASQVDLALALPSKDGYGFVLYRLIKVFGKENKVDYRLSQGQYVDYEEYSDNFFDGRR